jgi:transposase
MDGRARVSYRSYEISWGRCPQRSKPRPTLIYGWPCCKKRSRAQFVDCSGNGGRWINEHELQSAGEKYRPSRNSSPFCNLAFSSRSSKFSRWLDPVLPLSPGRAERHGFEYYRHGTLSLYAALDTKTGRVHGKTTAPHTSRDVVAFLEEVLSLCPPRQQIHIILDNLSAHKTQALRDFLQQHPRVQFHFTPTYSSWLNQVEIWSAKIEREVIARGILTSVPDLARKLRRYINAYSAHARPIQWKYSDPTRRLRTNELSATSH